MLETAPSLSIYTNTTGAREEAEERENGFGDEDASLVRSVTIGDNIDGTIVGSGDFSFSKPNMDLIDEEEKGNELGELIGGFENLGTEEEVEPASPSMYLAAGLGVSDGPEDFRVEREGSEEYYRDLLEEFPNHPLVLSNYANLLQSNGDLQAAEYYYLCAMQADPGDGEILSRYAQILWELYHDRQKALPYFERSVQSAPEDSNVLAAYAKFLWEIDDDKDEESTHPNHFQEDTNISVLSASHPADSENYYERMIKENPSDPLFLKGYAQFLYQSKGDLQSAEEYYSRAILADPQDGKVLSQYAKLLWELYHDEDKAASYFDKAIQAAPGDSDVLAAYASFLWTIDDDEDDKKFNSLSEKVLAGCTGV